ncbi:MAG: hypothetical protein EBX17_01400, partial [Betaproteobacteria bacterium]|nr:hypothetical protein [Betaproteobacteria bacterium]
SQTVEINQGSDRGLRVGMPVVNAAGLVGRITWVDNKGEKRTDEVTVS